MTILGATYLAAKQLTDEAKAEERKRAEREATVECVKLAMISLNRNRPTWRQEFLPAHVINVLQCAEDLLALD